jgi:hypothetical protein
LKKNGEVLMPKTVTLRIVGPARIATTSPTFTSLAGLASTSLMRTRYLPIFSPENMTLALVFIA